MEALHGDKSLDFDESTADKAGDAPDFLILLLLFAPLILCRRTRRSRSWQNDKMVIMENRYDNI